MKLATNKAVLKALGITQPHITALQLHMQPTELPRVTLDCLIDARAMLHEVLHFDLVLREDATPAPRPAFDLDALCAQARTRLAGEVHHSASMAQAAHHKESAAILSRLDKAIANHKSETAMALLRLDISPMAASIARAVFRGGNSKGVGTFIGTDFNTAALGGLK